MIALVKVLLAALQLAVNVFQKGHVLVQTAQVRIQVDVVDRFLYIAKLPYLLQ